MTLRTSSSGLKIVSAVAAAALLAGCSAGGSPPGAAQSSAAGTATASHAAFTASFPAAARGGLIYVADYTNSAVHIYPAKARTSKKSV